MSSKRSKVKIISLISLMLISLQAVCNEEIDFVREDVVLKEVQEEPIQDDLLQKKLTIQELTSDYPFTILLYKPNYIMFYNYNFSHNNNLGLINRNLQNNDAEVKYQISLKKSIFDTEDYFNRKFFDIYIAYTQLSFWQFYVDSAYFRESNYEPEMFLTSNIYNNVVLSAGLNHQSNGKGGINERSWNRAYFDIKLSKNNFYLSITPWILIFKSVSSERYNPDIKKYMGSGEMVIAYSNDLSASLKVRNIERGGKYIALEALISYPISRYFSLSVNAFHGYGQNLIGYNKKTTTVGLGVAVNNYI